MAHCQCYSYCNNPVIPNSTSPFCIKHQGQNCKNYSKLSGSEPDYQPQEWNLPDDLRKSHNCFTYAFNVWDEKKREDCKNGDCSFHQPGYAAGYGSFPSKKFKTCVDMVLRLKGDNKNFIKTTFLEKAPKGYSKIAIVVDPNADFHFIRQDSNGYWSHKPGQTNVTNLDSDGRLIFNPELANFCYPKEIDPLHYWKFCGFYNIPRNKPVFIKGGNSGRKTRKQFKQ